MVFQDSPELLNSWTPVFFLFIFRYLRHVLVTKERQRAEGRGQKAQAFWRPKGRSASAQASTWALSVRLSAQVEVRKSSRSKGIKPPLNESSVACIRGGVW